MARVKAAKPISISYPACEPAFEKDPKLRLYVVFTDLAATNAALKTAGDLARDLNADIVLLVAKVVPYPLPLEAPPVCGAFTTGLLSQLAAEQELDITVRVYLCRDRDATIRRMLRPGSLVVVGREHRWWSNGTPPLVRLLKQDGHEVILAAAGRIQPLHIDSRKVHSSL